MSYEDAPTLRPQLRELLTEALAERLGPGGAGLDPDAEVVRSDAARARRIAALDGVVLGGRRVLDLGSGLGDLARAARRRGAELVDAVDRDPGRVELARLLCVLQDVDRISFAEGDAGRASTYADEYDAILAFGPALDAMRPILPRVAQNLRGPLLAELPADGGEVADAALAQALPARRTLVEPGDGDGVAVVACASDRGALRRHLVSARRRTALRLAEGVRA
jgi:SAM-dependent methyltransferase